MAGRRFAATTRIGNLESTAFVWWIEASAGLVADHSRDVRFGRDRYVKSDRRASEADVPTSRFPANFRMRRKPGPICIPIG